MPKPWQDKNPVPYHGDDDPDGGPVGQPSPYEMDPGEGEHRTPNENPTDDDRLKKPGGFA